jgi:hypothetical protein
MKLTRERLNKILRKYGNDVKSILEVIDALGEVSITQVDWESLKAYVSREVYSHNMEMMNESGSTMDFWVLDFYDYKTVAYCCFDVVGVSGVPRFRYKIKVSIK